MEVMTQEQRQQMTHARMMKAITEWNRQAEAGESPGSGGEWDPTSVDRAELTSVLLEGNGPTTWFEFEHSGSDVSECRYWTSAYSDSHNSYRSTFVDVGADRGQQLFDLLRLSED